MNNNKLHILFLARWYPNKYDPMFGLFVQRHAEAAALYNQVSVIYIQSDELAKRKFEIELSEEQNISTVRIYYKKTQSKLISLIRFFRASQRGLKLINKPDVIHVHVLTRMGVVAFFEKKWHKTPYIVTEHWSRYLPGNDFSGQLRKLATQIVVKNAEMITTVTENLAVAMKKHKLSNSNYTILPNVVDTQVFHCLTHQNTVPRFVHVSCFEDKSKNISGLLQALFVLKNRGLKFQCTLIGTGIDYERIKKLSTELQLDDYVEFTGLLEGEMLAREIALHDFLVVSSHYENLPVVILEALACGLPVVSTQVGGIAEIINASNGILVPAKDTTKLAIGIENMMRNYQSYDKEELRQQIINTNSPNEVGKLLNSWYQNYRNSSERNE